MKAGSVQVGDSNDRRDNERRHRVSASIIIVVLVATVMATVAHGAGTTTTIAITGGSTPNDPGVFNGFGIPALNEAGQVAFRATATVGADELNGVYLWGEDGLEEVVREKDPAPDANGGFEFFSPPLLNDSGGVAFWAAFLGTRGIEKSTDDEGIFIVDARGMRQIAREGQAAPHSEGSVEGFLSLDYTDFGELAFLLGTKLGRPTKWGVYLGGQTLVQIAQQDDDAPDGLGRFTRFGPPYLNNRGEVAFTAIATGGSGRRSGHNGVYKGRRGSLTQVARINQAAPDGNGRFTGFNAVVLNDVGDVAFIADLAGTKGGALDDHGVYRGAGGALTGIARAGQPAPDGNGIFSDFNPPDLNDSGTVAFSAFLFKTQAGAADDSGVFYRRGAAITQVAREGSKTPGDATAIFAEFGLPALNPTGVLAFSAILVPTGGKGVGRRGIYLADGRELIAAVRTGDDIGGGRIQALQFHGGAKPAGRRAFNAAGQIAYQATLEDGREGVVLYTPALHWRRTGSGDWDGASNWTLGLPPGDVHDVFVDPGRDLTVSGPGGHAAVTRLVIGGGAGTATLSLNGGTLRAHDSVEIAGNGVLTGVGVIEGEVHNRGTVRADDSTVTEQDRNATQLQAPGRLHARLINAANGQVRVRGGEALRFSARGNTNTGRIEVNGGRLSFTHDLANETDGRIDVHGDAVLRVAGGLTNIGVLQLTGGSPQIAGALLNDGNVHIADGARVTFSGPVVNNAELRLGAGTQAVFRAQVSGVGVFSGFGGASFEGGFHPGGGTSQVTFAGDLTLGFDNATTMELGGTGRGTGHDAVDVGGTLALGGILNVQLVPHTENAMEFTPGDGDQFVLFRATHITGGFRQTKLPKLRHGLRWEIRQTTTEYVLAVSHVPRPVGN